MEKIQLIIDTDPGIDDAVAMAIALKSKDINVRLVSTVMGNVDLEKVTYNALKLLKFLEIDNIKVSKGFSKPLIREYEDASNVHGQTGMDGFDFPEPNWDLLSKNNAVVDMYNEILNSPQKVTIMAIAPLTNIAILIRMYPDIIEKIERIVLMGGTFTRGNKGVYSEFNIALDPEAAKIVFESNIEIFMAPMDVALKALLLPEDTLKIKDMNKFGEMFYSLFSKYRGGSIKTGLKMYDACAIAYITKPELFTVEKHYVEIDTQSNISAGQTYVDFRGYLKKEANINVMVDVDSQKFKEFILESIESF